MYDFLKPITVYYLRRMITEDLDDISYILRNIKNVVICRYLYRARYLYFLASFDGDLNYNLIHTKATRPYYIEKIGEKIPILQETSHEWKNYFTFSATFFISDSSKYAIIDLIYDFVDKGFIDY